MTSNVVAIDGPVGSGKSTVARALASALGWSYLDTGAMYRAVTAEALHRGLDPRDAAATGALAESVVVEVDPRARVDGRDVEDELRSPAVNRAVSLVAAAPRVRAAMVAAQRAYAESQAAGAVVEGRDIATVVFPQAALKVFLTATVAERVRRRRDEEEESVLRRDALDAARGVSPLRQSADARTIDTTGRTVADVVQEILACLAAH